MKEDSIREQHVKRILDKVGNMTNIVEKPLFNLEQEEQVQVEIKIDKKVPNGLFIPSKAIAGIWYANEQTFRAMKKDIFTLGDSLDEIKEPYTCHSCKTDLDMQFWHFCPYCGERFLT